MFWLISFWFIFVLIVAPIPFRAFMYISGKVTLSRSVIIDEFVASVVALFGCIGMYGFVYKLPIFGQLLWQIFLVIFVAYSVTIVFISPKLKMISDLTTRNKQRIFIIAATLITFPLPLSLYFYSFGNFPW